MNSVYRGDAPLRSRTAGTWLGIVLALSGCVQAQTQPHVWPCSYPTGITDDLANGGVVLQCGDGHFIIPRLYSHIVQHGFERCLMSFQAQDGFVTTDTTIPLCLTMALEKCVDESAGLSDMAKRCGQP